jgi:hypothetical protein
MNSAKATAAKAAAEAEAKAKAEKAAADAKAKAAAEKAAAEKAATEKAEAERIAKEQASKPVTPAKPTKPTKPVKETTMSQVKPLPDDATAIANDALGILIPDAKNRKIAYAIYGLGALVVSNLAVASMAAGIEAPVWLIVASAVVGNLAVPFTTLAIANAGNAKK